MSLIKNHSQLATTDLRKTFLDLVETGLESLQPHNVIDESFSLNHGEFRIREESLKLDQYDNVYLLGFGKGSAFYAKRLEKMLGHYLKKGFVIDVEDETFQNIESIKGTHPLPSAENYTFTKNAVEKLSHLTERDLVIVIICGGGSALLAYPYVSVEKIIEVNKALLTSGANIIEMNTLRKHLSHVKGGGLAKTLFPATVASLIFSDVPGNDLSFIASGPTVKDKTTIHDAGQIIKKYNISEKVDISLDSLVETPKEDKYFSRVHNVLVLSNLTALHAMERRAKDLGLSVRIFSDHFQSEASQAPHHLLAESGSHDLLLGGGETTVTVKGNGKGGRNQELALSALNDVKENMIIASIGTDGWDNSPAAGAIADVTTIEHAKKLGLEAKSYLDNNDSYTFFQQTGDAVITGHLPSNVSDLFIVLKKND